MENQIGGNASFQIFEAARRQTHGELDFLVKEEVHELIKWTEDDNGEFATSIKSLNRDEIIEAAVSEFRKSFTQLLNDSLDSLIDEF